MEEALIMVDAKVLENILKKYDKNDEFSGAVLVSENGEKIFSYACGYENMAYSIKNSVNTIFQTASATKIFTAVSVFKLIESGKIKLNSKIVDVVGLKDTTISEEVTVENLLCHTSGIADYFDEYDENHLENLWARVPNSSIKNVEDFLPYFIKKQPLFNPGEKFNYSNANYILLGLIIEKVSGMNYQDYVRKNIFNKYGLKNTDFISLDSTKQFAEAYLPVYDESHNLIEWKKNIYMIPVAGSPDGGVYSSVEDYNLFFYKLRNGEILSPESLSLIMKPKALKDVSGEELWTYNFGIWFNTKNDKIICYGVTGSDPGVSVKIYVFKESNITVVILGNKDNCSDELNNEIRNLILDL